MKNKIFTALALFSAPLALNATDYHVSTEPEGRSVLLEEFTGVNCGNCPDGHRVARAIETAQPERVHLVNIHAGYYSPDSPDYKIDGGEEIDAYFTPGGYPSGMLNRQNFSTSSPVCYRSNWYANAREVSRMDAPVNLWAGAKYDGATKKLTVDVEGYFTASIDDGAYLTVYLVQDGILGPQSGGNMGNNYVHNHMLRAILTPTWGDQLENCNKGEYFTRQYTYDVPEKIGSVEMKPEAVEIIAFVTKEKEDVLNVTSAMPEYTGVTAPTAVATQAYKLPVEYNYGFNFVELYVENKGIEPLTTCTFEVELNGKKTLTEWEGEIAPRSKAILSIDTDWLDNLENNNTYSVRCVKANGTDVEDEGFSGSFTPAKECGTKLKFQIKTDNFASDNTFYLKDVDGNIVKEFGPYPDNLVETYEEELELEEGKYYCFEINDAWADGIYTPRGRFRVYDISGEKETLVAQNLEIQGHGYRAFVYTGAEAGVENIVADEDNINSVYTLDGRALGNVNSGSLPAGIYIVNGKKMVVRP